MHSFYSQMQGSALKGARTESMKMHICSGQVLRLNESVGNYVTAAPSFVLPDFQFSDVSENKRLTCVLVGFWKERGWPMGSVC